MPRLKSLLIAFGIGALLAVAGIFAYTQWYAAPEETSPVALASAQELPAITVFKSPTCGCCSAWVEHLRENGFEVRTTDTYDMASIKARYGVPEKMSSCHTALVDGYVVEGHVPAQDIKRMLDERPEIAGLTVPGMPVGSPGMEQGDRVDPYAVLTFAPGAEAQVFNRYN